MSMKWCRFTDEGSTAYGIIEGDAVAEVSGSPFGEYAPTGRRYPLDGVALEVPVIPPTFFSGSKTGILNCTQRVGRDKPFGKS